MKYLLLSFLLVGLSHAQITETSEDEIEVGTARDCEVVGKSSDQSIADELTQIQQKITDCLAPQEEQVTETKTNDKHPEVVTQ